MVLKVDEPRRQYAGGTQYDRVFKTTWVNTPAYTGHWRHDSTTSPGPPYVQRNYWMSEKIDGKPGYFTGTSGDQFGVRYDWNGFRLNPGLTWEKTTVSRPYQLNANLAGWTNAALAGVNPTRPEVSILNMVWELRNLPYYLYRAGMRLKAGTRPPRTPPLGVTDLPGGYLAWVFGWLPLLDDLRTLINLAEEIEETQRRFSEGYARRKLSGTIINTGPQSATEFATQPGLANIRREWQYTHRVWYTAHYEATKKPPEFIVGSAFSRYWAALGLSSPASVIWEAVPWSFLIDYFVGVGTYLEAVAGMAEFNPATICLMRQEDVRIVKEEWIPRDYTVGTYSPGSYKRTRKERWVIRDPQARMAWAIHPLVGKLDILSALSIQRLARR